MATGTPNSAVAAIASAKNPSGAQSFPLVLAQHQRALRQRNRAEVVDRVGQRRGFALEQQDVTSPQAARGQSGLGSVCLPARMASRLAPYFRRRYRLRGERPSTREPGSTTASISAACSEVMCSSMNSSAPASSSFCAARKSCSTFGPGLDHQDVALADVAQAQVAEQLGRAPRMIPTT